MGRGMKNRILAIAVASLFLLSTPLVQAVSDDDLNLIEAAGRGDMKIFNMMR